MINQHVLQIISHQIKYGLNMFENVSEKVTDSRSVCYVGMFIFIHC